MSVTAEMSLREHWETQAYIVVRRLIEPSEAADATGGCSSGAVGAHCASSRARGELAQPASRANVPNARVKRQRWDITASLRSCW